MVFQSPKVPSNDNCNGFVEAFCPEKIVTVNLKQRNGMLSNCGCFRRMAEKAPPPGRVTLSRQPEEPSIEAVSVSTVTKEIDRPLRFTLVTSTVN